MDKKLLKKEKRLIALEKKVEELRNICREACYDFSARIRDLEHCNMIDKIDRKDYRMYLKTAPLIVKMLDKFDELVEGYDGLLQWKKSILKTTYYKHDDNK